MQDINEFDLRKQGEVPEMTHYHKPFCGYCESCCVFQLVLLLTFQFQFTISVYNILQQH